MTKHDALDGDDVDRRPHAVQIWVTILVCGVSLVAGYLLKACPSAIERTRLGFACHTDITALYRARGIDRGVFPYVGGALKGDLEDGELSGYDLALVGGANEYPVLTGLFMWTMGLFANDAGRYLAANAAFLSIAALVIAGVLGLLVGWRSLLWSGSPLLILFAFHNWDLLAVAATTLGLLMWWRGHPTLAAVMFAIGGALKLYPLLLVLPLVVERWWRGERRGAAIDAAAAAGVAAAANLPLMLLDLDGWFVTYRFHSLRPPNYDSLWGVGPLYDLGPTTITGLSGLLLLLTVVLVLVVARRRADHEGSFPFIQTSAALIAAFLLWGKVQSPQYALWIVPFFALVRVRAGWWIAYTIDAVVLYLGVFVLGTVSLRALEIVVPSAVYLRALLLIVLIWVFLRSEDAIIPIGRPVTPSPSTDRASVIAGNGVESSG